MDEREFRFSVPSLLILNLYSYMSGFLGKKVLKLISGCEICKKDVLLNTDSIYKNEQIYSWINAKNYCPDILLKPSSIFVKLFCMMVDVVQFFLPRLCLENKLTVLLRQKMFELIGETYFRCKKHGHLLFSKICNIFIKLYILRWIKEVNNILKGNITYNGNDNIKKEAFLYYSKFKLKKKAVNNIKKL